MSDSRLNMVLRDLEAEYDRLDSILAGLSDEQWATRSLAPEWTIRDVVVHLALTEEMVVASLNGPAGSWTERDRSLDSVVDDYVRRVSDDVPTVFRRWQAARRASVAALRAADPTRSVNWAAAPLRPVTLATTRLAEHWAHGLDITEPLGIEFPDTDRLRHIAWLGHATLPYALSLDGLEPVEVFCALTAPDGTVWTFGNPSAENQIRGSAGLFCRVGARRLPGDQSGLNAEGPRAAEALRVLRNYAA